MPINVAKCRLTNEGFCQVTLECLNCKIFKNNTALELKMTNERAEVKLYDWTFESYWSEDFNFRKGYSKLEGTFLPTNDLKLYFKKRKYYF